MKAMARQRSHSIEFKRQVAQEFIAGESLYAFSKRHDISRQLIRVWVQKYEAGALDEDAQAADLLQGTSNNTLLWLSGRLRRSCQGGPPIGDRFDA
jgi:transposase-like protein